MSAFKKYCEENGLDESKVFNMVVGHGGGVLPQAMGYTGYFTEITDGSIICTNEKLKVKKEIPLSSFKSAEFGIGSGNLWLQCNVDGQPLIFCSPRKSWKSDAAKLLISKISEHTEVQGMKDYERFTGKLFFIYMFK